MCSRFLHTLNGALGIGALCEGERNRSSIAFGSNGQDRLQVGGHILGLDVVGCEQADKLAVQSPIDSSLTCEPTGIHLWFCRSRGFDAQGQAERCRLDGERGDFRFFGPKSDLSTRERGLRSSFLKVPFEEVDGVIGFVEQIAIPCTVGRASKQKASLALGRLQDDLSGIGCEAPLFQAFLAGRALNESLGLKRESELLEVLRPCFQL